MAKITEVKLICPEAGMEEMFEISHAERLLRRKRNGGWRLPDDSKFEFIDNGIRCRRNKKEDSGAEKEGND